MSKKHPIISVTGSSGAGTSTVKGTFDQIFRREGVTAVSIEGDAFHRYNRADMKAELERRYAAGDQALQPFQLRGQRARRARAGVPRIRRDRQGPDPALRA